MIPRTNEFTVEQLERPLQFLGAMRREGAKIKRSEERTTRIEERITGNKIKIRIKIKATAAIIDTWGIVGMGYIIASGLSGLHVVYFRPLRLPCPL